MLLLVMCVLLWLYFLAGEKVADEFKLAVKMVKYKVGISKCIMVIMELFWRGQYWIYCVENQLFIAESTIDLDIYAAAATQMI